MFTFGRVERYRAAMPGIRGSAGPQIHRSDGWYKMRTVAIRITVWAHISSLNEKR